LISPAVEEAINQMPKNPMKQSIEEPATGRKFLNSERDQNSITSPSEFGQEDEARDKKRKSILMQSQVSQVLDEKEKSSD
jgi:hypothetical protein